MKKPRIPSMICPAIPIILRPFPPRVRRSMLQFSLEYCSPIEEKIDEARRP
jgi:hypothetical protein